MFSFKFWYTHLYREFIHFRMKILFFLVHLLFYIHFSLLLFVQMSLIKYHVLLFTFCYMIQLFKNIIYIVFVDLVMGWSREIYFNLSLF
jgi:hypothetical protein